MFEEHLEGARVVEHGEEKREQERILQNCWGPVKSGLVCLVCLPSLFREGALAPSKHSVYVS